MNDQLMTDLESPSSQASPYLSAFNSAQYNAMGDGITAIDAYGTVILSDKISRESLEIYPKRSLAELYPGLWDVVVECMNDRRPRHEISLQRGDSSFFVSVNPIVVDDAAIGATCVFVENTTMGILSRQLRSFRELSKELAAIIDSSSEGLWVCDGAGIILRVNPASERLNNLRKEEVIGRNVSELVEEGIIDRSAVAEVMKSRSVVHLMQGIAGRKLITTGVPVFDDDGELIRVVVTERDITEIDRLQRELEDQEALKGQFWHHMMEQQQVELATSSIIAKSPEMIKALRQAIKVAAADSTVLILGESGVGKGLFADLIHQNSSRATKPLIKLNCGAIPESLIESELFGYEKGAFTGANTTKPGYLELADEGILFLDEIAELPPPSQVKLLRFLEDGRVTRLGGTTGRKVNVRIIAATHRDLEKMVEEKTFRLDFYYRLNVVPLHIPSLKERKNCLLSLLRHYIDYFAAKNGTTKRLSRGATDALLAYDYPGNVRELMNLCERLVVMSDSEVIDLKDLPRQFSRQMEDPQNLTDSWPREMNLDQIVGSIERSLLVDAMKECGNQYRMADALGIHQSTVARKLKRYGLT